MNDDILTGQDNLVATSGVHALRGTGLNDFLFADVGIEANGMTLSVVSIFARQGSDPWREAGRLAELPKADAASSLASTIAGMPHSPWTLADAAPIAARLIELLPTSSARVAAHVPGFLARWQPSGRTTLALLFAALGVGYAIAMLLR